jgi:hypothetical protein
VDTSTNPTWTPVAGPGFPAGGTTGQYLQKRSNTDYDTQWSGASNFVYRQTLTAPTAASSPYPIPHNLGTQYVHVQIWDAVTGLLVQAQVQVVNVNTIQLSVTQNMPNNVNVVVMGSANLPAPVNPTDIASKSYVDARTPNLPAPVTSGSGVQSFTDVLGDVWVAQNGVAGGAWKRARDVLHGFYHRAGAWTAPTAWANFVYDTLDSDPYVMYNTSTGVFTPPVAGMWQIRMFLTVSPSAAALHFDISLFNNTTGNYLMTCSQRADASSTWGVDPLLIWWGKLGLTDAIQTRNLCAAAYGGQVSPYSNCFDAHYMGTG